MYPTPVPDVGHRHARLQPHRLDQLARVSASVRVGRVQALRHIFAAGFRLIGGISLLRHLRGQRPASAKTPSLVSSNSQLMGP
jgi:hypothetical protein